MMFHTISRKGHHMQELDHLSKSCIPTVTTTGHFYLDMVLEGHIIRLFVSPMFRMTYLMRQLETTYYM